MHPARVLVAQDDRWSQACALHQALLRVQVGRAHPGAPDLHDDVARGDRLRIGPLDQLERAVVLLELGSSHALR
jgi:hypothetical protein